MDCKRTKNRKKLGGRRKNNSIRKKNSGKRDKTKGKNTRKKIPSNRITDKIILRNKVSQDTVNKIYPLL